MILNFRIVPEILTSFML